MANGDGRARSAGGRRCVAMSALVASTRQRSMRATADVLRFSLVCGAAAMLAVGRTHAAVALGLVGVGAMVLRIARSPAGLDLAFVTLLCADAWATSLGAFEQFNREDRPGHLLLSALATPVLFHLVLRTGALRAAPHGSAGGRLGFFLVVASLGMALGVAWELLEYGADALLETNMSLGYGDTMGDLVADAAGTSVAAALLTWRRGRRPPPVTAARD
jgi:hypothetical protein